MHKSTENPFLFPYDTLHETVPFDRIKVADVEPAVMAGIEDERKRIAAIADNPEPPTFLNTIVAMECSGELLERVTTVMYNLLSAETCDALDKTAQKLAPVLAEHSASIMMNERLFERVRFVKSHAEGLDREERMLLDNTYQAFERSGATLDENGKKRFKAIVSELSELSLRFSQNVLKDTNAFELHVTQRERLAGLPDSLMEQLETAAREKGRDGWLVTLHAPVYQPFMMYAEDRDLRKQLYMAYNTKCTHDNDSNNFEIVRRIVNLKREKAQLLGCKCYAEYALKRRMAGDVTHVYGLLDQLLACYMPAARKEVAAIADVASEMEGAAFQMEPWDFAFYAQKLKMRRYALDPEMLRPYFELSKVKAGIFSLAERLYGITFRENKDIPVYHPDVTAYEVFDRDGAFLAVFYADFYPREGKQPGAWMTSYKEQWREADGTDSRPHVSVVMNLTKPTPTKPSLLTLGEVETFLHEFGHALHGMFSKTRFRSLSGTNVYWDFVELPSQIMENFAVEKDFLRTFARHYETGAEIPEELVGRIVESRNYNAAYACLRQLSFGFLDMAYYTLEAPFTEDVRSFEHRAWAKAQLQPPPPEACMSVQFGHIMSGGYSAGYYSYKWAEVLDADAFSLFKEKGIFSRDVAARFRECILSKGGTADPTELYVAFRGQQPTIDALLERNGLGKAAADKP